MPTLTQQKRIIGDALKKRSWAYELIFHALNIQKRRHILAVLFTYEATHNKPMAYAELRKKTKLSSNDLAYHLKVLRQAGLVEQVTPFPLKNATRRTGYRSYYKTTALALMVMNALTSPNE